MAKFLFRLQGFLNLRMKLEDQKKMAYGQALNELEEARAVKTRLINEKDRNILEFKNSINKGIQPGGFRNYNDYIELLKKRIIAQDKVIKQAENKVEMKRKELVEAVKERKMLDTLKESAFDEYKKEEALAEQKQVDQVVSYQYNKRES